MNPKFDVGEVVILQSQKFPEYNGEYEVARAFLEKGELITCRLSSRTLEVGLLDQYGYHFTQPLADHDGQEIIFLQASLRKKQQPSQFTYGQLMSDLNTKIQERC